MGGSDGMLVHLPSKQCVVAVREGLAMQSCASALRANDGRSSWLLAAGGEIQKAQTPELCLSAAPGLAPCSGLGETGKWSLVAVPEHDPGASTIAKYEAVALAASLKRQQALTAELRGLLPKLASCKLTPSFVRNATGAVALVASAGAALGRVHGAEKAIDIYSALGIDMSEVGRVIAEGAGVLDTAQGKLTSA